MHLCVDISFDLPVHYGIGFPGHGPAPRLYIFRKWQTPWMYDKNIGIVSLKICECFQNIVACNLR